MAPYQNGSAGWKDGPSVGFKVDNDGNQTPQEVRSVSHPKTDASASLPHMIDVTMKNVKITPAKGKLSYYQIRLVSFTTNAANFQPVSCISRSWVAQMSFQFVDVFCIYFNFDTTLFNEFFSLLIIYVWVLVECKGSSDDKIL